MKQKRLILLTVFHLSLGNFLFGEEGPAAPVMSSSQEGSACFINLPGPPGEVHSKAQGTSYLLKQDGKLTEIWHCQGWFSKNNFISDDGVFLVTVRWPTANERTISSAFAIYKNGKLTREYTLQEISSMIGNKRTSLPLWEIMKIGRENIFFSNETLFWECGDGGVLSINLNTGAFIEMFERGYLDPK